MIWMFASTAQIGVGCRGPVIKSGACTNRQRRALVSEGLGALTMNPESKSHYSLLACSAGTTGCPGFLSRKGLRGWHYEWCRSGQVGRTL